MDETTAVTKQRVDEGNGLLLRVGEREYYRYGEDPRWFAQPSGRPVDEAMAELLDALDRGSLVELAPEEPKPLDVEDVFNDLVVELTEAEEAYEQELGHPPTPEDRSQLCPEDLAGALYGRYDSVAVAAVTAALERPYRDGTLGSAFRGEQECC